MFLKKIDSILASIIFISIFFIMVLNIILRNIFSISLDWPIELSRYLLVWLTIMGSIYLFRKDYHIAADSIWVYLKRRLNKKIVLFLDIFKSAVCIFFGSFILFYGYELSNKLKYFSSPSLGISQSYLYMIIPTLGGFIILFSLISIYKKIKAN